jgi:small subunit ribosomal protein S11
MQHSRVIPMVTIGQPKNCGVGKSLLLVARRAQRLRGMLPTGNPVVSTRYLSTGSKNPSKTRTAYKARRRNDAVNQIPRRGPKTGGRGNAKVPKNKNRGKRDWSQRERNAHFAKKKLAAKKRRLAAKKKRWRSLPVQGSIYMRSSRSNTILTLTGIRNTATSTVRNEQTTLACVSGGQIPFVRKAGRGYPYAARMAALRIARKSQRLGIRKVAIHLNGRGRGRQSAVRAMVKSGLVVSKVDDRTSLPHNGCRLRKERRKKRATRLTQTEFDRSRRLTQRSMRRYSTTAFRGQNGVGERRQFSTKREDESKRSRALIIVLIYMKFIRDLILGIPEKIFYLYVCVLGMVTSFYKSKVRLTEQEPKNPNKTI